MSKQEMTNEEAIKIIEIAIAEVEWNYPMEYTEAFKLSISALEKQIPKKPTPHIIEPNEAPMKIGSVSWGDGLMVYECPDCKKWVSAPYRYCDNCGQALEWGDTDD